MNVGNGKLWSLLVFPQINEMRHSRDMGWQGISDYRLGDCWVAERAPDLTLGGHQGLGVGGEGGGGAHPLQRAQYLLNMGVPVVLLSTWTRSSGWGGAGQCRPTAAQAPLPVGRQALCEVFQ